MANTVTGYLGAARDEGQEVKALGVLQPFVVITATQDSYAWQGDPPDPDNIPAAGDMIVVANSNNIGWVRVAINATVGADNYVPLYSKDVLGLPGVPTYNLHLLFEKNTDKVHLVYMQEA